MLLKPEIKLERVTDITTNILKKYNIEALILADILGMTFEVEGDVVRMKLV